MEVVAILAAAVVMNLIGASRPARALYNRMERAAKRAAVKVQFVRDHGGKL